MLRVNLSIFPCRDEWLVDIEVIWRPRCGCTILLVAVLPHLTPGEIVWDSKKSRHFFQLKLVQSPLQSPQTWQVHIPMYIFRTLPSKHRVMCSTTCNFFANIHLWCHFHDLDPQHLKSTRIHVTKQRSLQISAKCKLKHLVYFSKSSFRAPSLAWHWKMDDFLKKNKTMNLHLWVLDHRHFHWGRQIGETKHLPECIQNSWVNATIGSPGLSI